MRNILSIQSWVAYGHVGNAAAVFPLQRMGFEVWALHTVQFSNHTGYGAWKGLILPPEHLSEVVQGIAERGVLEQCDAVLSGYMGSGGTVAAIMGALERVRAANPQALYCCDPVMGDVGRGVFVRPEIPEVLAQQVVPQADILTPNQFELELLSGHPTHTLSEALTAARLVQARLRPEGPGLVLVTSLLRHDAPPQTIETLAVGRQEAWLVQTPLLPLEPPRNGTGDLIAALFLGHYLQSQQVKHSLEQAVSALFAVLELTHHRQSREIQLVASQDQFVQASHLFGAQPIG